MTTTPTNREGSYADLSREVRSAGLLDRGAQSDIPRIVVHVALLAVGWAAVVLLGHSWYQLLVAAYLAVVSAQLAFVAHDIGHLQTRRSRWANDLLGLAAVNLLLGMSFGWWVNKHNRHHAHPNQLGKDPDIGTGALVWTAEQARNTSGLRRTLAQNQARLFFPMLTLEALNLHLGSIRAIPKLPKRRRKAEGTLLALHFALTLGALFFLLPPLQALAFITVHQGMLGLYLGSAFAPNHKGMPILSETDTTDFLHRQILTAHNVRGGWLVDWALGGLNYQIEHHLFPTMPRRNLRHCQPLVRSFCARHGLLYTEVPLFATYAQIYRYLRAVTAPIRFSNSVLRSSVR
jgi:fatty acid desaturase